MRKLLKALLFGLADFTIIAIAFFLAVSFKMELLFVYIFMVVGLIAYAAYLLINLKSGEEIVKKQATEKLKPIEIVKKPEVEIKPTWIAQEKLNPLEKKEITPQPLFKEIKKEEAVNFDEIIDYIKYNLYYGHVKEKIINRLLNVGWTNKEIERAFSSL